MRFGLIPDLLHNLRYGKSRILQKFLRPQHFLMHKVFLKCLSLHFPEEPVMPGVLIIEALAQVGAVAILSLPENKGKLAFFGGIKNARFKKQVRPGDVLELSCELIERRGPIGFGKAVAKVDGKVAAQGELTFAVGS